MAIGVRVDAELPADGGARGGEALTEDAETGAVRRPALPYGHEVAAPVHIDVRSGLGVRGEGVDAEIGPEGGSGGGEALAEDGVGRAVPDAALPHDDEVARGIGADA